MADTSTYSTQQHLLVRDRELIGMGNTSTVAAFQSKASGEQRQMAIYVPYTHDKESNALKLMHA